MPRNDWAKIDHDVIAKPEWQAHYHARLNNSINDIYTTKGPFYPFIICYFLILHRTFAMGRDNFYLVARKLAYDIIRHHLWIDNEKVRLAILIVANETTTIVNGISTVPLNLSKCKLFPEDSDDSSYYWNNLEYDGKVDCVFPEVTRVVAYNKANEILWEGELSLHES